MKPLFWLSTFASLGLVAACAPTNGTDSTTTELASSPRQCFFVDQLNGFSTVDRDTVHLDVGGDRVFVAEASGFCNSLGDALSIGIVREGGLSSVCTGDWVRLSISGGPFPDNNCRVRLTQILTREEASAARAAARDAAKAGS